MHWFLGDDFEALKNIFECLSYIATIAGVAAIWLSIKSIKLSLKDSQKREESELMDKSMEILGVFADEIIPKMNDYNRNWRKKYDEILEGFNKQVVADGGEILKDFPEELVTSATLNAKLLSKGGDLLNKFERISAYISHDLVLDDVVYTSVHKVFLGFIESNNDMVEKLSSEDAPYQNLHDVYGKWRTRCDRESLEREQTELNKKRVILEEKRSHLEQKNK